MAKTRVLVAGHHGMVGSAIVRLLALDPEIEILTVSKAELNYLDQFSVNSWFAKNKPDQVYLAAAKVGGIYANNTYPAQFIYENLMIEANVIQAAHINNVQKLLFLGSSCIYPRDAPQPMREEALLTGKLELTNEPYAIAKIAGIKLCESFNRQFGRDYRSIMPTNLYGPNDNYHAENSHVIPGLLRRFHEATQRAEAEVSVWGTGNVLREFLHVDDMASACTHLMSLDQSVYKGITSPMQSHINAGSGVECSIKELAHAIASLVGFGGVIKFDSSKPDGSPRKIIDSSKLRSTGWYPRYGLIDGLSHAYESALEHALI